MQEHYIKTKRLKVLILSHSSELGGAERSMLDLFDYWTKHYEIEPHFIIRQPLKNMAAELRQRNWSYHPLYYTNWSQRKPATRAEDVFRNARENAKAVAEIEKLIEKIKPDVVMTNTIVSPWAAIAAHFQRVPHVWFVREYGDIDHKHVFELGREKMIQDIESLSNLILTNSATLAGHISEYATNSEKIGIIYTPFNMDLLARKAGEKTRNPFKHEDSLKVVITGRIAPSKGQAEAAAAVASLAAKGHAVELCVIGSPAEQEDAEELNQVIAKNNLQDRVHLLGHVSNPLAIIKYADIGVMASHQEAFGRVTFEYMASGLPVVGADSGATPELIDDGVNGFLYDGSTKDLARKLEQYLKSKELVSLHGRDAKLKAGNMMKGKYTATAAMEKIIEATKQPTLQPFNFTRRWLDYPLVAQQYIDDSQVISFKRIVTIKVRGRLKAIYLKLLNIFEKDYRQQ